MAEVQRFTAIIEREGDIYVALCPELDIASQGASIEEARANLGEALSLFLECAPAEEVRRRIPPEHVSLLEQRLADCESNPDAEEDWHFFRATLG